MKIDILKHTILNTVKSLWFWMKKPDRKFIKTILENMIQYKTTVLSQLWDKHEKTAREWKNYFSKHLWNEVWANLWEKIEKIMVKLIWKLDKNINFFCFDTVDINKNSAKKMEWLKIVRDWTSWTLGNGYTFHWVSIKWIPLFLKREKIKTDEDKSLKFDIFKEQILKIVSIFWIWYWILADRWYDDFKKFKLLIENNLNFCIRLKTNRKLNIIEGKNKWKIILSGDLEEWNYTVKIAWVKDNLYIFVKKFEWFTNPIRVISNINDEKNIKRYLKRWEIERIFKTWKQEFDFEKIGTKAIQKTDNLVALVQLSLGISAYIFNKINPKFEFGEEKNKNVILEKMYKKIRPFLKKNSLTLNRNSITNFLGYYMKIIRKTKSYFKKTTVKPWFSWQLSLL